MKGKEDNIALLLKRIPESPGVYQYFDKDGQIIYVGKAKNLHRRVNSYFSKDYQSSKTRQLVAHIADIKYVVVDSEQDAFLLENNLIKQYQPHYNILLKDGKSYPSICITREPYPRIFKTRTINKKVGEYYGPFGFSNTVDM
ncbi:MAG: GIY-YIG nuclease family protein, partial [Paludibacteraceae bacterium]|nr:GIY-YIG nuclease family protein [Paludibacteraceae bacterium]